MFYLFIFLIYRHQEIDGNDDGNDDGHHLMPERCVTDEEAEIPSQYGYLNKIRILYH